MKNITEILKAMGIEIPADKVAEFEKAVAENYKTVAEVDKIKNKLTETENNLNAIKTAHADDIKKRDTDFKALQDQLATAGADEQKLKDLQAKFDTLTNEYTTQKENYAKELANQKYQFTAKEMTNGLKFTSNGAKKTFFNDLIAKNLPIQDDTLLGFDDYVKAYKEADAGAFAVEEQPETPPANNNLPAFVAKSNSQTPPTDSNPFGFAFTGVRPHEK